MISLAERVRHAMEGAGIKARTFAVLVGCHFTTIYDLLKNPETVPLRIVQENIYDALDFLEDAIQVGILPINEKLTVAQKTQKIEQLFKSYMSPKQSESYTV